MGRSSKKASEDAKSDRSPTTALRHRRGAASGKATEAAALAKSYVVGVHIAVDDLRYMVVSGRANALDIAALTVRPRPLRILVPVAGSLSAMPPTCGPANRPFCSESDVASLPIDRLTIYRIVIE
jgi:hypothetical protein